jgi:enamine deaminase RidA (YjgF/YER057c/UK114 family)
MAIRALLGGSLYEYDRNGYTYCFKSNEIKESDNRDNSYLQTRELLKRFEDQLSFRNSRIENNCVRTWFFLRDIDIDYEGMVKARTENFSLNGLTSETHYIASTGIEGRDADARVKVKMDTYHIDGLEEGQMQFLYAKENMSPTHEYGVTFERGVYIDFGDRRNVYISGTASIDKNGQVLFPESASLQTFQIWENVEALLQEADCDFGDLMQIIVYLRDISDYTTVKQMFDEKFPQVPKMIVLAPICRTQWLVEMECIAAKPIQNNNFRNY